jgi:ATP-binding cassette subfamily F protein uup
MTAQEADRAGFKVIACEGRAFAITNAGSCATSLRIERGDKIGIVGPQRRGQDHAACGMLLGQLAPQAGTVEQGTRLEVVYFDQLRAQLDETMRVQDAVADGNATVTDQRPHAARDFLPGGFSLRSGAGADADQGAVGGERNRLLLARLFTKPANVLVLDEPTNDLDAETLELLEDMLVEFGGTVLLVSHDRSFLNEVCTSLLVFEGDGRISEYIGGYDDWQREREARAKAGREGAVPARAARSRDQSEPSDRSDPASPAAGHGAAPRKTRKLTNKERAEREALPKRIEALEAEQAELTAKLADPVFFKTAGAEVARATTRLQELEAEVAAAYERWAELEG